LLIFLARKDAQRAMIGYSKQDVVSLDPDRGFFHPAGGVARF
jgi:hypothetical protein